MLLSITTFLHSPSSPHVVVVLDAKVEVDSEDLGSLRVLVSSYLDLVWLIKALHPTLNIVEYVSLTLNYRVEFFFKLTRLAGVEGHRCDVV